MLLFFLNSFNKKSRNIFIFVFGQFFGNFPVIGSNGIDTLCTFGPDIDIFKYYLSLIILTLLALKLNGCCDC